MTRRPRAAFTLLEILIGMAISSMLIASIYLFYMGLTRTQKKSEDRIELNTYAKIYLEQVARELQMAVEFTEIKPDQISFRRPEVEAVETETGGGYEVNMDLESRKFDIVTYRRKKLDKRKIAFQRVISGGMPETLFTVQELSKEIFRAWVIPRGAEEDPYTVPDMISYDPARAVRSDLQRIPLVRIAFHMKTGNDSLQIATKAFIPPVYAKIVQPDWNR